MADLIHAFGINWKLLVIQTVNFGLLLFVLHRFLYKPVLAMLEERRAMVEKGVTDAQAAEELLRTAEHEKGEIVSKAVLDANTLVNDAKKRGAAEEQKIVHAAQEKGFQLVAAAEKKAEEEKTRIMREAESEIAQLVVLGMEKTLRAK
jgi:F-type H+-transporting ATPase subunit b